MFENPHGLEEVGADEKAKLKILYQVSVSHLKLSHSFRTRSTVSVRQGSLRPRAQWIST